MPVRLFIALETPPDIKPRIRSLIADLKQIEAEVKWEPAEKLHATVKFLGNTDEELVGRIVESLNKICIEHGPISLMYSGLGCFPPGRRARVIWIGMKELTGALQQLARSVEDAMEGLGFEREQRTFTPHLTIGRVKGEKRIDPLLRKLETVTFDTEAVALRELILVRSVLKPGGSEYTILNSVPFGNG